MAAAGAMDTDGAGGGVEAALRAGLGAAMAAGEAEALKAWVDGVLGEDVPQWVSRDLLQALGAELPKLPQETHKAVAAHAIERVQPRVASFEEQASLIREQLAALHEGEEDWARAAQILGGINLDSGNRQLDDAYKLGKCVKIALLYLEDDDPVKAESYIKRASFLVGSGTDPGLKLQYKACAARISDSKRRFLEAAIRYYELSQLGKDDAGGKQVDEADLEQALTAAITCTILAAAGPQRSRLLATLHKDERSAKVRSPPSPGGGGPYARTRPPPRRGRLDRPSSSPLTDPPPVPLA